MKKWIKTSGIIAAIAAVSVISFAAVSFAQTPTPTDTPNLIQQFRNGIQDRFGGRGGHERGGDENFSQLSAETQSAVATALNMSVADLQAAIDGGQTLTEIATAQGVDMATVQTALNAARLDAMKTQLADKVAAGDITQEQADAMLQRMESGDLFGKGARGDFDRQERGMQDFSDIPADTQAAMATALNMSVDELQAAMESGQTLPQIAETQGVDMATVTSALNAARLEALKVTLAEKVAAGDITQEQADAMLEKMESGDFPGKGGMKGHPGGRDGGRDGMKGHPGGRGGMRGLPDSATPDSTAPDGTNFQAPATSDSNL